jgi:hypothetical protein
MVYYLTQLLIFRVGVGVGVKVVSCTVFHSKKEVKINQTFNIFPNIFLNWKAAMLTEKIRVEQIKVLLGKCPCQCLLRKLTLSKLLVLPYVLSLKFC